MTKKNNKKLSTLAVLALLFASSHAFAQESFNNNLLKAELHKSAIGGVKVVLFTGKPYTDAVTVNKKADNEYVILLPETSNSSTGRPSLRLVSDVIKDVEIKTQPCQNNIKGYTKVVIRTNKPLEISTNVQTLNPSVKLSENEYKELLSQASKSQAKSVDKPKSVKVVGPTPSPKLAQAKIQDAKKVQDKISSKSVKIAERPEETKNIKKKISAPKTSLPAKLQKVKNTEADVAKVEQKEVLSPQVKNESIDVPKAETNIVQTPPKLVQEPIKVQQLTFEQKLKQKASNMLTLLKNDLYLAIGSISALFILLLLIARRMTKNISKSKANFNTHLKDKPDTPVDYSEKVTDDMSWKEKFKACTEPEISQDSSAPDAFGDVIEETIEEGFVSQSSQNEIEPKIVEIDELFTADTGFNEFVEDIQSIESLEQDASSTSLDSYIQAEDSLGEDVTVDDIFSELESEEQALPPEQSLQGYNQDSEESDLVIEQEEIEQVFESQNDSEIVKSEFVIDSKKSLYLVDFEDSTALVGNIDDEIFVLKRFDSKIDAKLNARVSETSANSTQYMTRVGNFRGVVEVTPDNMNLLIEL